MLEGKSFEQTIIVEENDVAPLTDAELNTVAGGASGGVAGVGGAALHLPNDLPWELGN